ncbi:hypothetical protein KGA66_12315 [Actinocrinis puniceicyclus]|uniref:ATP-dependent helicase HepA n=1 Tax=Actinocrinis puniceicyclus TaxID=977794 RepID=A0A8J7WKA1_9ACTN|nr:protein DpdE [Actinocrinis puniceicyclus]MBS2963836.1 hypothetical protein [Actinocrinis puniceicyclus]
MTGAISFVRHAHLGLGRLVDSRMIRFFDAPFRDEVVLPLIAGDVSEPLLLDRQQRVWWHDGSWWLAGYVDSPDDGKGQAYLVKFPNGRSEHVPARDLYVRWSQPLADPVGLLQTGAVETRFLHERRLQFLRSVAEQRIACQGLAGIWSAGVTIYPHQAGAARRVLTDPVRRYLLADEVGLGKTVEAGMVIRQFLLESSGNVAVIVPAGLLDQWRHELTSKFRVDEFDERVQLIAHEELAAAEDARRALVVVDEAHRLAGPGDTVDLAYQRLRAISHAASGLLLLSATPVRSNEDGYLRMLHLMDPVNYPLEAVDQFRRRVVLRDELAAAVAALGEETPVMFLAEPVETLKRLLPDEHLLREDLDALSQAADRRDVGQSREISRRVRAYVTETHRIHRRMIRTRRGSSVAKDFPVRGRSCPANWLLVDEDRRRGNVLRWLDDLRAELAGADGFSAAAILRTAIGRACAPVVALADLAVALRKEEGHDLDEDETGSLAGFAGTDAAFGFADRLDDIIASDTEYDRFTAMIDWAWPRVSAHKVAVVCSFASTAAIAAEQLEERFGIARVVRLLSTMPADDRAQAARRFAKDPFRSVIVLDRCGEEGINLQMVEDVLHLDLPVNIARLEQRLGRFDRWSAGDAAPVHAVRSTTFRESDEVLDAHLGAWRRLLDEGVGLFEHSCAVLQYILPETELAFLTQALDRGLSQAAADTAAVRAGLNAQRRRIESHDLLDAIEEHTDDDQFTDAIHRGDDASAILRAFRGYAVEALQFTENTDGPGVRYGVSSTHPPLLPASEVVRLGPTALRRRYSHRREEARDGVGLLRWGEPLVDKMASLAECDDRGRAFAVEVRQGKREPNSEPMPFFCFDILVAPDPEPVDALEADSPASASAARIHLLRLCPPRLERVWWNSDQGEPSEPTRRVLEGPEVHGRGRNLGSQPERFAQLTSSLSWQVLCERAARESLKLVAQRSSVGEHIAAARHEAALVQERERAIRLGRRNAGFYDETDDEGIFEVVNAAISDPQLTLDACGVVIITAPEA